MQVFFQRQLYQMSHKMEEHKGPIEVVTEKPRKKKKKNIF